MEEIQTGIYQQNDSIYTKNANPGENVYGEPLIDVEGDEYRKWEPKRSKAGAAVKKHVELGLDKDDIVLYLGAASGTTVSHFADVLEEGLIVGVEYSDTVARKLVRLAEKRDNIAPVLGDARNPEGYEHLIDESDVVFQDISQRDQPEIFLKNVEHYLKDDGVALIAVKAKSISDSRDPEEIYSEVKDKLTEELEIVSETTLEPYETDHLFLKMKWK
jgi:fibrillarin-like pre-rRNA processing protein